MTKRASDQAIIGESGVHLVQRIVDEMGHLWHPTIAPDSGIDGEIELRDPESGEVRNVRIGVQVKATTGKWDRENDRGFTYRPKPADLAYWLSSSQPVLLVCTRGGEEAYYRSVQEWARDPSARARGHLRFNKERHRFDAEAGPRLFDLKAAPGDWIEPPGPRPVPERLASNLMPITWIAEELFSIRVPPGSPAEVLQAAWKRGIDQPAGVLRGGRYWSFASLAEEFVDAVTGDDPRTHSLAEMRDENGLDDVNLLKELVVRTVVDRHGKRVRWFAPMRCAYFRRRGEQEPVRYAWGKGRGRTVVRPGFSNEADRHFTGYRHDAAELRVRELSDRWALQLSPTYVFTWDGVKLSGHHDKALAGIKRMDRHRAVSAQVRMWAHLFRERNTLLDQPSADCALGDLLEVNVGHGVDEAGWAPISEEESAEAEGTLLDPDEETE